jgi:hypothetical protein
MANIKLPKGDKEKGGKPKGKLPDDIEAARKKVADLVVKRNQEKVKSGSMVDAIINRKRIAHDEYSGGHQAPYRDEEGYHPSMDDLSPMYGSDFYQGGSKYHVNSPEDQMALDILMEHQGNPDAEIEIYRAVPLDADDEFNARDWISLTPDYAHRHGKGALKGEYKVLKTKARVGDLYNEGYLSEWGFDPSPIDADLPTDHASRMAVPSSKSEYKVIATDTELGDKFEAGVFDSREQAEEYIAKKEQENFDLHGFDIDEFEIEEVVDNNYMEVLQQNVKSMLEDHPDVDHVTGRGGLVEDDSYMTVFMKDDDTFYEIRVKDHPQARGGGMNMGTGERYGEADGSIYVDNDGNIVVEKMPMTFSDIGNNIRDSGDGDSGSIFNLGNDSVVESSKPKSTDLASLSPTLAANLAKGAGGSLLLGGLMGSDETQAKGLTTVLTEAPNLVNKGYLKPEHITNKAMAGKARNQYLKDFQTNPQFRQQELADISDAHSNIQTIQPQVFDERYDKRKLEQDKLKNTQFDIKMRELLDKPEFSLEDLEGKPFVMGMADRVAAGGELTGVDGVIYDKSLDLRGGQDYMFDPVNEGQVWANDLGPANMFMNLGLDLKKKYGENPLWLPWTMAPSGGDFNTMTSGAMLTHARNNLGKSDIKKADKLIKDIYPEFKGVDDPDSINQLGQMSGDQRKAIINVMDVNFRDKGGLSLGQARLVVGDPKQYTARDAGLMNIGELDVDNPTITRSTHDAFPYDIPGQGKGVFKEDITAFDLIPEKSADRGLTDTTKPRATDIRALSMNPELMTGVITEDLIKSIKAKYGNNTDEALAQAAAGRKIPDGQGGFIDPRLALTLVAATAGGMYAANADAGIRGWHGTPHTLPPVNKIQMPDGEILYQNLAENPDMPEGATLLEHYPKGKFDMSKIGTGEGAQAYGHGLYFAEAKGVANDYRRGLSGKELRKVFQDNLPDDAEIDEVMDLLGEGVFTDKQEAVIRALNDDDWLGYDYPSQALNAVYRGNLRDYDPSDELVNALKNEGNTYEVDLDVTDDELLDWDAPLSEQSEGIIERIMPKLRELADRQTAPMRIFYDDDVIKHFDDMGYRGEQIYERLGSSHNYERATEKMHDLGIKGIKYWDADSRAKGEGTRNIVMFDEDRINILNQYELGGGVTAAGLAAMGVSLDNFIGDLAAQHIATGEITLDQAVDFGTQTGLFNNDFVPTIVDKSAQMMTNANALPYAMNKSAVEGTGPFTVPEAHYVGDPSMGVIKTPLSAGHDALVLSDLVALPEAAMRGIAYARGVPYEGSYEKSLMDRGLWTPYTETGQRLHRAGQVAGQRFQPYYENRLAQAGEMWEPQGLCMD